MCESETAVLPKSGAHCCPRRIVVLPLVKSMNPRRRRGVSCCPLNAPVPLFPPKKSVSIVALTFQLPTTTGPLKIMVRRVLRTSPPPNQQSTAQFGGFGYSAFCPLPNVKF